MSFVNQNQFPCILLFFDELKDQLLSIGDLNAATRGPFYMITN